MGREGSFQGNDGEGGVEVDVVADGEDGDPSVGHTDSLEGRAGRHPGDAADGVGELLEEQD